MSTSVVNDLSTQHGKFKVSLPSAAYNSFIPHSNFKSNIDFGFMSATDAHEPTSMTGAGNTQKFILKLTPTYHYYNTFVRESTIIVTVKDIRFGQNRELVRELTNGTATSHILEDFSGLPHPYLPGLCGFVCDPINSMSATNRCILGLLNEPTSLNPALVNILRKSAPMEVLQNGEYQNLLYPETVNLDSLQCEGSKLVCMPFRPVLSRWSYALPANDALKGTLVYPHIAATNKAVKKKCVAENIMTLEDINESPNNMLSFMRRGKVFETAKYTFTKKVESQNYRVVFDHAATGTDPFAKFEPYSTPTKELYPMKIGLYFFPTDVYNWEECLQNGLSPYELMWYYDKLFAQEKTNDPDSKTPVKSTIDFKKILEPSNQALTIKIEFPNIKAPLINATLSNTYETSFVHMDRATVETDSNNLYKIFKCIGTCAPSLVYTGLLPDATHIKPNAKSIRESGDIVVALDTTDNPSKVWYRLYQMDTIFETFIKHETIIPALRFTAAERPLRALVSVHPTNKAKRVFRRETIHSDPQPFTDDGVARYILLYCEIDVQYKITKLEVSFGDAKNHQMLNLETLRQATIRNGVHLYNSNDEGAYLFKTNGSPSYLSSNITPYSQRIQGRGTVLLLKMGTDIVLPESIVGGLMGNTTTIKFKCDVEYTDELVGYAKDTGASGYETITDKYNPGTTVEGTMYFTHIREVDFVISQSAATSKPSANITAADISQSYNQIMADTKQNNYYSNRYHGSGAIDVAKKAITIVPKLIKAANTIKNIHDSGAIQQGVKDVQKLQSTISQYLR